MHSLLWLADSKKMYLGADWLVDADLPTIFERIQKYTVYPITNLLAQPAADLATVHYRQGVWRDTAQPAVDTALHAYSDQEYNLSQRRLALTNAYSSPLQWVNLVQYWRAVQANVQQLRAALAATQLDSLGLNRLMTDLAALGQQDADWQILQKEADHLARALTQVNFTVAIQGLQVRVTRADADPAAVLPASAAQTMRRTWAPMLAGELPMTVADQEAVAGGDALYSNAFVEKIVEKIEYQWPALFSQLHTFYEHYRDFHQMQLMQYRQEIPFYLALHQFWQQVHQNKLPVTLPHIVATGAEKITANFELGLLAQQRRRAIVTNAYDLDTAAGEHFLLVSGPNQGGKSTYVRGIMQAYTFAALGSPIAGECASLCLPHELMSEFERPEHKDQTTGLLKDDLLRLKAITDHASAKSFIVLNEPLSSTSSADGLALSRLILRQLIGAGARGSVVSFLTALADMPELVPMMSQVQTGSTQRTYRIIRQPLQARAYAESLLTAYHLHANEIKERITDD